jgi:hypothetical protein
MQLTGFAYYGWTGQQSGSGFPTISFNIYFAKTGSENTFLSELCVIRGHFGRYFGQNNEIVRVFNGSVVHFTVGEVVVLVKNFTSSCSLKMVLAVGCR